MISLAGVLTVHSPEKNKPPTIGRGFAWSAQDKYLFVKGVENI